MRRDVRVLCGGGLLGLLFLSALDGAMAWGQKAGGTPNDRAREQMQRERERALERAKERDREREREKERKKYEERQKQDREAERRESERRESARRESEDRARQSAQRRMRDEQQRREDLQQREEQWRRDEERRRDRDRSSDRERPADFRAPNAANPPVRKPGPPIVAKPAPPPVAEPEQLTQADVDALIKALESDDEMTSLDALRRLAGAAANNARDQIAPLIAKHVESPIVGRRQAAVQALAVWSTPGDALLLRNFLADPDKATRLAVIHGLGELKDAPSAGRIAAQMATPSDRAAAGKALKEIGGQAEEEVVKLLRHDDMWVRVAAIEVLTKIGGKPAGEALQLAVDTDAEEFVRTRAQAALRQMGARAAIDAG